MKPTIVAITLCLVLGITSTANTSDSGKTQRLQKIKERFEARRGSSSPLENRSPTPLGNLLGHPVLREFPRSQRGILSPSPPVTLRQEFSTVDQFGGRFREGKPSLPEGLQPFAMQPFNNFKRLREPSPQNSLPPGTVVRDSRPVVSLPQLGVPIVRQPSPIAPMTPPNSSNIPITDMFGRPVGREIVISPREDRDFFGRPLPPIVFRGPLPPQFGNANPQPAPPQSRPIPQPQVSPTPESPDFSNDNPERIQFPGGVQITPAPGVILEPAPRRSRAEFRRIMGNRILFFRPSFPLYLYDYPGLGAQYFYFPFYGFGPAPGLSLYPSPFGYCGNLPQYILGNRVTIIELPEEDTPQEEAVQNQNPSRYLSPEIRKENLPEASSQTQRRETLETPSQKEKTSGDPFSQGSQPTPSLREVLADIQKAWETKDPSWVIFHLPEKGEVYIYLKGKPQYALSVEDYAKITADAIEKAETVAFEWLEIRSRGEGKVYAEARHQVKDLKGKVRSALLLYYIERQEGSSWAIVGSGSTEETPTEKEEHSEEQTKEK